MTRHIIKRTYLAYFFKDKDECATPIISCGTYNSGRPESSSIRCHNTIVSYEIETVLDDTAGLILQLYAHLFYHDVAIESVICKIQGSFWCEVKQNPREEAVWRDFKQGIDMGHYK